MSVEFWGTRRSASRGLVCWAEVRKAHVGPQLLPLFGYPSIVRDIGSAVEGFLSFRQIIELDVAHSATCPRIPIVRIILNHTVKHRKCFVAASFSLHLQC